MLLQYNIKDLCQRFRKSTFRGLIWPIKSKEMSKFLPMAIMMFTVLLNQNLIRSMKDSIVMILVGPEVIGFIKLWCEMPAGIIFVLIYTKLCNIVTTEVAFRYIVIFFVTIFCLFAFILFPYHEYFHPDINLVESYIFLYPHLKWFIVIWSKWSFILFYVMGELWPVIVLGLWWQLANKITTTEESKRFYPFFALFGQLNLLISGLIIGYLASNRISFFSIFHDVSDDTEATIKSIMTIVIFCTIITLTLHRFVEIKIIKKQTLNKTKKDILSLSLIDSFKMILKSKYLGLMCILICSFNIAVILIEGIWFAKAGELYNSTQYFMIYHSKVLFWTGVAAFICSFLGGPIIRKFGWFIASVITPITILIVGGIFFICILLEDKLEILFNHWGEFSALSIIVFIGALQNILGKGTKYSLFDATKEMAYIPLDNEMKTKGKTAVDVVGTKAGKSLASIFPFITFSLLPNAKYDDISGLLLSIFMVICILWIYATYALSKEYDFYLLKNQKDDSKHDTKY